MALMVVCMMSWEILANFLSRIPSSISLKEMFIKNWTSQQKVLERTSRSPIITIRTGRRKTPTR